MTKEKVKDLRAAKAFAESVVDVPAVEAIDSVPATPAPVVQEKMQEQDRLALELAKSRRETALAQAKEAVAKNETAELAYKYVVLQLYMKYSLTQNDAISEAGDIVRGGAVMAQTK